MDDLIIRVLSGAASPFEEERLRRWRAESSENEAYYQETSGVWHLTAPEPLPAEADPPTAAALVRGTRPHAASGHSPTRGSWIRWGALAASAAAVVIGIRAAGPAGPTPLATYEAPPDQNITITLGDGTFVRLDATSRLREWESRVGREVSLVGRGFFAVAPDETRPFTVAVGDGRIRVSGTRFEVSEEEGTVRTVVVEGRVEVSSAQGSVQVPAGSVSTMREGEMPEVAEVADVHSLLHWPEGTLVFQGSALSEVALEVSRHFGRPLEITGEDLGNRLISAWFGSETFEEVAESLCLVLQAECRPEGTGVRMMAATGEVR